MIKFLITTLVTFIFIACNKNIKSDSQNITPSKPSIDVSDPTPYDSKLFKFEAFSDSLRGIEALKFTCEKTLNAKFNNQTLECQCSNENKLFSTLNGGICLDIFKVYSIDKECFTESTANQDKCFRFESNIGFTTIKVKPISENSKNDFLRIYQDKRQLKKFLAQFPIVDKHLTFSEFNVNIYWKNEDEVIPESLDHLEYTFPDALFFTHGMEQYQVDIIKSKESHLSKINFPSDVSDKDLIIGDCRTFCSITHFFGKNIKQKIFYSMGLKVQNTITKNDHRNNNYTTQFLDQNNYLYLTLNKDFLINDHEISSNVILKNKHYSTIFQKNTSISFPFHEFEEKFHQFDEDDENKSPLLIICDSFNYWKLLQSPAALKIQWNKVQKLLFPTNQGDQLFMSLSGLINQYEFNDLREFSLEKSEHGNNVINSAINTFSQIKILPIPLDLCTSKINEIDELLNLSKNENQKIIFNMSFLLKSDHDAESCKKSLLSQYIIKHPQHLFVFGAGNSFVESPKNYCPQSFHFPNVLVVAGSTNQGQIFWNYSNYGENYADIAADIFEPKNIQSGTSYSTPKVAAISYQLATIYPDLDLGKIKESILYGAKIPNTPFPVKSGGNVSFDSSYSWINNFKGQ